MKDDPGNPSPGALNPCNVAVPKKNLRGRKVFRISIVAAATCVWLHAEVMLCERDAAAQSYPSKPIRLVLPVAPGGGSDIIVRVVTQKLTGAIGQQFVIDYRGGANGNIAHDLVAKAAPDGYTLLWVNAGIATNASLYRKLNHDPLRDFTAITQLTSQSYVFVAHPSVPVKNVQEFVALSNSRKGGLVYASTGAGSLPHLGMELLKIQARVDGTHIPYKGAGPALIDVMGGQVDVMMPTMIAATPFVKNGKLRALAVTSAKRAALLPEVPSIAEQGYPAFEVSGWYGMLAPTGTPKEAIALLNAEIVKVLRLTDVGDRLASDGAVAVGSTPEAFGAYIRSEMTKWGRVIKASGASAD
jgi:tripartite-type tricarboxylate transporter receptor subunit TctC